MSKAVIFGITNAGKTCYFYGMLNRMTRGYNGFSLRVAKEDFPKLRKGIKRLQNAELPPEERFPEPSSKQEIYEMDLLYNMKKLDSFTWVDYPGELIEEGSEEFLKLLDDATCLILCVDGEAIQGSTEDIDDIVNVIYNEKGGFEVCNALQQAEGLIKNGLPPVCIIITKYDVIPAELRKMNILLDIIKQCFPLLFHEGNGRDRIVTLCPVTLGRQISYGGKLEPVNVEKPVCFANYLIQTRILEELRKQSHALIESSRQAEAQYRERSWLARKFLHKPTVLSEEQKQAIYELLENGKADLKILKEAIHGLPLFINGIKTEWPES